MPVDKCQWFFCRTGLFMNTSRCVANAPRQCASREAGPTKAIGLGRDSPQFDSRGDVKSKSFADKDPHATIVGASFADAIF
jgi:hypothetical protein